MKLQPSQLCYLGPYMAYLILSGIDVSEGMIYVITKGFHFEYDYIHNNKRVRLPVDESDWISIVGSNCDFLHIFETCFNTTIKSINISNDDELEIVLSELEDNKGVVVCLAI